MSTERSDTSTTERGTVPGPDPSDDNPSADAADGNGSLGSLEEDGSMVDWREQLRERVRQIRARKMAAQRAAETGFEEPRDVAQSIAASAARAQELRRSGDADEPTDVEEAEAAADAVAEGERSDRDEGHEEPEVVAEADEVVEEDSTTDPAGTAEAATEEPAEEIPESREPEPDLDELMEGVGDESDRSYDDGDTPEHTTFELDEPAIEAAELDEADADPEADDTEREADDTELEASEGPTMTGDDPETLDDDSPGEPPESVDDIPMFQEDPDPFDFAEGPSPSDRDIAAADEDGDGDRDRPITGWWPRQSRDDDAPALPPDAQIPAWARARKSERPDQAEARTASGPEGADAAREIVEDPPEQETTVPDESQEASPAGHDTDEGAGESHEEAAAGGPSELADVPIPAWAQPRNSGGAAAAGSRRDADDVHLVGEFRSRDSSREEPEPDRDETSSTASDARREAGETAGGEDDRELPFLPDETTAFDEPDDDDTADAATTGESPDPPPAETEEEEPRRSALEELLGETDLSDPEDDARDGMESRFGRRADDTPVPSRPPEETGGGEAASTPEPSTPEPSTPEPSTEERLPAGTTPPDDDADDDLLDSAMDDAPSGPGAWSEEGPEERAVPEPGPSVDTEDRSEAEEGAVPAAARAGLDLDAPAEQERDLEWDLDAPGDPDTVLDAQKPSRRVDESSAPISDRFFSALCDGLVLLAVGLLLVAGAARAADTAIVEILRNTPAPFLGAWLVFAFAYGIFFNGTCGQTLGKMIMRVRVIGSERFHIGYGRAARRAASYLLATLPAGLGLLPALRDTQHRALHDRLSGTRVVKA